MKPKPRDVPGPFAGPDGPDRIADILRDGRVLRDHHDVATELARLGTVQGLESGGILFHQDAIDNAVFFVLSGAVDIVINGQPVAQRRANDILGELALLEPSPRRSATVVAREPTWLLRLRAEDFLRLVDTHPLVWKGMAREIAERLRQRGRLVPCANGHPRLFLGSSVERLRVVDALMLGLRHNVDLKPWTDAFRPSHYTVDELSAQLAVCDFAAFVFAPDDVTRSRGRKRPVVRDNVLFEVGLFMGILGRERVFLVKPLGQALDLPSDLTGLKPVDYAGSAEAPDVNASCAEIRRVVSSLGCRKLTMVTNP